jgi:hypothetical protein
MAIKLHNSKWLLLALLSLAEASGCFCQAVPLPGECHCPTDARRLYCTCGEEAVRRCPCGPDSQFYGLKPTCWREWPEGWQCNGSEGTVYVDRDSCGAPVAEASGVEFSASQERELPNPFHSMPGTSQLPLSPTTPPIAPKQLAPAQSAPVQLLPAQPTPAAPPALETIPMETAPANKNSATEQRAEKSTILVIAPPKAPAAAPPIAPVTPIEAIAPQSMPIAPAATKQIMAAAPCLIAPQNAWATASPLETNPQAEQVAVRPKVVSKQADDRAAVSPTSGRAENPALSNRVEEHLLNNLRL